MASRKVQRATITDVARMAGVSISTVSRVLNETAPVSGEAAVRVRSAVEELNFIPHAAARTLAVRKTDTVGLMLPAISDSFFVPTLRGIEAAVREAGLDLLILAGSPSTTRRNSIPLGEHNTDGLLIFTDQLETTEVSRLHHRDFPIVLLHRSAPDGLNIPSVRFDNRAGMRKLLKHLIEVHGRRRIVFLRGPVGNEDSEQRELEYRRVLEEHAIAIDEELFALGDFADRAGEEATRQLLQKGVKFDAIFAGDDEAAAGALMALRKANIRVPQDVALVGFDDMPIARHLNPPLTTVRAPIETASYLAARKLVRLIQSGEADAISVLPVELVVRQSCGCP